MTSVANLYSNSFAVFSNNVDDSTDTILISNANTYLSVNDLVKYIVPENSSVILGLDSNNSYYVSFANSSSIALSLTKDGSNVSISPSILAPITNVSGNGTYVTFTANNNFSNGWNILVSDMFPSSYNGLYENIFLANATHFVVANTNIDTFEYGGTAREKIYDTNYIYKFSNTNALTLSPDGILSFAVFDSANDLNVSYTSTNIKISSDVGDPLVVSNTSSNVLAVKANGNVLISKGLIANDSLGSAGQVLTTNGSGIYWSTVTAGGGGNGTVTSVATGNGLSGGPITTTGTISVLANNGITSNNTGLFVAQGTGVVVNSIGVHVNSAYIGTLSANNTTYVNGKTEGNLNVNNAATVGGNTASTLRTYSETTASNAYTNAVSYVDGKSYVNTSQLSSNLSNYQTTAGLAANVATLAANSATYLGNSSGTIANISSWITSNASAAYSNAVSYTDGKISTANSAITGNAATAYSNAVSYVDGLKLDSVTNTSVSYIPVANTIKNAYDRAIEANTRAASAQSAAISAYSNAVSYTDGKIATANSAITGNAATAYSNAVSYTDGKILTANSAITGNAATAYSNAVSYVDSKIATANSAITGNAATAYSNSVSYTDSKIATANSAITGNAATAYSNAIAFAANASNITTGTLPYAQIPANIINTTANFTISGVHTHNANVVLGTSGLSANSSYGAAGHVLHSNGTATYWAADDQGVTSVTAGNGLSGNITTTGTISVVANTGIVANVTGVYVNSTYIGTLSANNTTYVNGKTEANLNVNSAVYATNAVNANNADYLDGQHGSYYTNATNISTGTLAEARLPYRMNQNVTTSNDVTFGSLTLTGNLTVSGNVTVIGANNLSVVDNMIYLNSNNTIDNEDIGLVGNYNTTGNSLGYAHTGIFRDASDGYWKVFDNYAPEPDANVNIDTSNTTFHLANFQANLYAAGNTSTNWFIANTSGAFHTGTVNAASYTVGTSFTANSTVTNTVSLVVSTNTATIGTGSYFVSNGNVGIGTATPAGKLDVYGGYLYVRSPGGVSAIEVGLGQTSNQYALIDLVGDTTYSDYGLRILRGNTGPNTNSSISHRGSGSLIFSSPDSGGSVILNTAGVDRFILASNGNVGIGNSAPTEKLQIQGNIQLQNGASAANTSRNAGIRFWTDNAFGAELHYGDTASGLSSGYATAIYGRKIDTVAVRIGAYPVSNTSQNTFSEYITVLNNGNVGIGNSSPAHLLSVNGGALVNTHVSVGNSTINSVVNSTSLYFNSTTSAALVISKPASNSSLNYRFDVGPVGGNNAVQSGSFWNGWHFAAPVITLANSSLTYPRTSFYYSYTNTTAPTDMYFNIAAGNDSGLGTGIKLYATGTDTVNRGIDIAANGNVGIGTSSPVNLLDVAGMIRMNSATQYNGITFQNGTYEFAKLYGQSATNDNGVLSLNLAGTTNVLLRASGTNYINGGNLGIGTNSPSEKLHVVGRALIFGATAGTTATLATETSALSLINGTSYNATPSVSFTIGSSNWDAVNNNTAFQWLFTTPSTSGGASLAISSRSFNGTSTYTTTERVRIDASGNILPGADNTYNLGSLTMRWANIYTGDLHLSNEKSNGNDIDKTTGNWTIQEGENDLYIINNKNGKKFKFKLEEIQ